jgi:hypothetical protein
MKTQLLKAAFYFAVAILFATVCALVWSTSLPEPEIFALLTLALIPLSIAAGILGGLVNHKL